MFEKKFLRSLLCLAAVVSFSVAGARGANILFISSMQEQHMPGDEPLKAFMESLGHTVTYLAANQDEATTEAAAAAADMVFISESCGSGQIKNEITEVEVPIIVGEPYAWDEMGLTEGGGADEDAVTTEIEIVDPVHYLSAGLRGTVAIFTDITGDLGICQPGKGIAGSEAAVIARATLADGQTYDVIFVYEKGAALAVAPADGSPKVAADIRVCFGFHLKCHPLFNENAYALFEAAINYALGMTPPPALAAFPRPRDGATDVQQEVALTWKPGAYVEGLSPKHRVFLSENFDDVSDGIGEIEQDIARYPIDGSLSLDLLKTYYWRVDEANSTTGWDAGPLWQFTVVDYFVVDDFESYNDLDPNDPESKRIFNVWIDGYGIATNGSVVGYENAPFCEQTIVQGGKQSMPFFYNNTGGAVYSEAELPLSPPQNWTKNGVKILSLYFHGDPSNAAGQMYVKVNGSKVVYDGDAADIAKVEWKQWNVDLASFGINLQNVTKLSIGTDGNGVSGKLFFDDIRLYLPQESSPAPVGHWQFDEGSGTIAADSSGSGLDGTISGATWVSPGADGTGSCLDFDGQGTNLVDLGNFDVTGNGLTIACWCKADNLDTPGNDPRLFSKAIGGSSQDHWFMVSSSRVGGDKVLRFRLKTDGDTGELKADTTTGIIDLDVWTHVAAVWDGATMKLYKNGVEVGSLDKGGTLSTNPDANVAIGNQPVGTPGRPWDGLIDDVRIYDLGLSQAEIDAIVSGQ